MILGPQIQRISYWMWLSRRYPECPHSSNGHSNNHSLQSNGNRHNGHLVRFSPGALVNRIGARLHFSRQYFEQIANTFLSKFDDPSFKNSKTRTQIINFLERKGRSSNLYDLPQLIYFLSNLVKLKEHQNTDGTKIEGIHRLFIDAYKLEVEQRKSFGIYVEAVVANHLIDNGYKVEQVSVTHLPNHSRIRRLRTDGLDRQIDIIASKDDRLYFIDVKATIKGFLRSEGHNNQPIALVRLAKRYKAEPVVIFLTQNTTVYPDGRFAYETPREFSSDEIADIQAAQDHYKQKGLHFWSEFGRDVRKDLPRTSIAPKPCTL